jgi:hypothetical protein
MKLPTWAKCKLEENWPTSLFEAIIKVEGFSDVGRGEKSRFKKDNKFPHKKAHHEGEWNQGKIPQKEKNLNNLKARVSNPKEILLRRGPKGSQPKGDASAKPKGVCFNCNEMGHYSKDFPKPKLGNGGFKVIALIANLAQIEYNCLNFLKGKAFKREVLCFLDIGDSHNFITQESVERMEFKLEELKAPIEVHFVDGFPIPPHYK